MIYEGLDKKNRIYKFVARWSDKTKWKEDSYSQSMWHEFFSVMNLDLLNYAQFEYYVSLHNDYLKKKSISIDLLCPDLYIVEHKSGDKNLEDANDQLNDYIKYLKLKNIEVRYAITCNFRQFKIEDLKNNTKVIFDLKDLPQNLHHFNFMYDAEISIQENKDPVTKSIALKLGKICNELRGLNVSEENISLNLVRLIFSLYMDTSILIPGTILKLIHSSKRDGSDLGMLLNKMYHVLNTPIEEREKNLPAPFDLLPYVGGTIFKKSIDSLIYTEKMRNTLMEVSKYNWKKFVSPLIIGNIYQESMSQEQRRDHGIHYTSEKNIYKIVNPIMADVYEVLVEQNKNNPNKLRKIHAMLASKKILDPACGSGNFLTAIYKKMGELELKILKYLYPDPLSMKNISLRDFKKISINQFRGIEIDKTSAALAEVALIVMDMHINKNLSEYFGVYFDSFPLDNSKRIIIGNALEIDWRKILPKGEYFDCILGNPPYHGGNRITAEQSMEILRLFHDTKGAKRLDYSVGWMVKFAEYIKSVPEGHQVSGGFILPASIINGQRGKYLWDYINNLTPIHINFAHQPFRWKNGAGNIADVIVIILGISNIENEKKYLYEYKFTKEPSMKTIVDNISPMLLPKPIFTLNHIRNPLSDTTKNIHSGMYLGPDDLFKLKDDKKIDLCSKYPFLLENNYIKRFITGMSFAMSTKLWCLDMKDIHPIILKDIPEIFEKFKKIKDIRTYSKSTALNKKAEFPLSFIDEYKRPKNNFMVLPKTFSIYYHHVPLDFYNKDVIPSTSFYIIENPDFYSYAILSSKMFKLWCDCFAAGRGGSSGLTPIIYYNFPWPEVTTNKKNEISQLGEHLKEIVDDHILSGKYIMSKLYNFEQFIPPMNLQKVFNEIDMIIEHAYRKKKFKNNDDRLFFLYELNQKQLATIDNNELNF